MNNKTFTSAILAMSMIAAGPAGLPSSDPNESGGAESEGQAGLQDLPLPEKKEFFGAENGIAKLFESERFMRDLQELDNYLCNHSFQEVASLAAAAPAAFRTSSFLRVFAATPAGSALGQEETFVQAIPSIKFSRRELEVITMACREFNSIQIADKLCINVRTVENHRKRILEKTNSKNFIGAILYALKNEHISLLEL